MKLYFDAELMDWVYAEEDDEFIYDADFWLSIRDLLGE